MTILNTSVIMDIATDAVAILVVVDNSYAGGFPGQFSLTWRDCLCAIA